MDNDPNSPPLLKAVGGGKSRGNPLRRLDELNAFIYKHSHDAGSQPENFSPFEKLLVGLAHVGDLWWLKA